MKRKKRTVLLEKIKVEDYAAEGKSLAHVDGKVVFIENAVPGDIADVQLFKNKKDWAEGFVTHYHQFSELRVEPFCSHFGVCGGCQWQMLPYDSQLKYKQKQVKDQLTRISQVTIPELDPIIGAGETQYYRNKLEYTFSNRRFLLPGELRDPSVSADVDVAGYHAKGIFDKIIDIDRCYLQAEPTNEIRKSVKAWAIARRLSFYDIRSQQGWLRNMQVRITTTGEIMVNLIFGFEDEMNRIALLQHLGRQFPQITTLLYTINPKKNDSLTGLDCRVWHGDGFIVENLGEFRFKIGPKSFFQTNTRQAEKLYGIVRDFSGLTSAECVYDLYCGTGSIGIFLSPAARQVIGVELVEEAIADAIENAALNGVRHARFFAGDVIDICNQEFFTAHGNADLIIVDPPRAGLHEKLIKKMLDMDAPRIVYVSCNPATQARDLKMLDEKYLVAKVQPVDMFPHTHHIENVAQLIRRI
ncbi:MAG TPA: 23S rRNA (uracil(1939)-C(5))-methyltransferase RlmD [Puia sp.]|nr:23S rRNA (uracil(1939)-C(5))-methyltransferase RlmD [Puia sp.]